VGENVTYIDIQQRAIAALGSFARVGVLFHDIAYRQLYLVVGVESDGMFAVCRFGDPAGRTLRFPGSKQVRPCSGEHRRLVANWLPPCNLHGQERSLGDALV
jgi:hypothetical protein